MYMNEVCVGRVIHIYQMATYMSSGYGFNHPDNNPIKLVRVICSKREFSASSVKLSHILFIPYSIHYRVIFSDVPKICVIDRLNWFLSVSSKTFPTHT